MIIKTEKEIAEYLKQQMALQNLRQTQLKEKMYNLMPDNPEDYYENETLEQKAKRDKQKLADNISKWLKGDRYPGTEYLFYLSQALKITIENILTCGESNEKYDDRVTLYSMAKCKNLSLVDKFMSQDIDVFINYDEYDKTLIDYIIEFKNIELIKYFLDKEIISFNSYYELKSNFRLYPNENRFYDLLEIIIENDELDYFKRIINRSTIVNRDVCGFMPLKVSDGILLKILKSNKILKYLCDTYIPNDTEWNYNNRGVMPKDDRIRAFSVVTGWYNELLRVAINNGLIQQALDMIDFGIKYNNMASELVGGNYYLIDDSFAVKSRSGYECLILLVGCKCSNVPKELIEKVEELNKTINKCGRIIKE